MSNLRELYTGTGVVSGIYVSPEAGLPTVPVPNNGGASTHVNGRNDLLLLLRAGLRNSLDEASTLL